MTVQCREVYYRRQLKRIKCREVEYIAWQWNLVEGSYVLFREVEYSAEQGSKI